MNDDAGSPLFFTTTVFLHPELPELTIITLPGGGRAPTTPADPLQDARAVVEAASAARIWTCTQRFFDTATGRDVEAHIQDLLDADARHAPELYIATDRHRRSDLYEKMETAPFPVMNSPIDGTTLAQLFEASGTAAAMVAMFPHNDFVQVGTLVLAVGGTKIVLGAADGIAYALNHGLRYMLLKWMGAPTMALEAEEKRTRARNAMVTEMAHAESELKAALKAQTEHEQEAKSDTQAVADELPQQPSLGNMSL